MKACRVIVMLLLFVIAVLTVGCATGTSSSPTSSTSADSCAARAEPTALKITAGSGITPPKAVHRVEPLTPASLAGREAVATLEAVIGEDGSPRHICFRDGDPDWGQSVAAALANWRFEPATLQGKPVAVLFTLTTRLRR